MKRFVVLLLALLLPICTLAESVEVTVQVKTGEALFTKLARLTSSDASGSEAEILEKYMPLLKTLMKDISVTVVSQENAYSAEFSLSGNTLFDLTAYMSGSVTQMTSSLIPGYVLEEKTQTDSSIHESDFEKIETDVKAAYENWLAGLKGAVTTGVFSGDAYAGGVQCTTWIITDREIAELLSAVMTPDLRALIQQRMTDDAGETDDTQDILAAFDAANARVSKENKYSYLVRSVKDENDEIIGLSLSAFDQDSQLATMSVGLQENALRLVIGLGLKQQNYWTEWCFTRNEREGTAFVKGVMREWTADKSESFAYVSATNAPAASFLLNCTMTTSTQRILWDGHVYKGAKADHEKELLAFSGTRNEADDSFESAVSLMEDRQTLVSIAMTKKPALAIQPPAASLIRCSAENPAQEELYTKITQTFAIAVTAKLLQIIPIDVLLMMDGLFQ